MSDYDGLTLAEYQALVGTKKRHRNQPEFDDQCAVFRWRMLMVYQYPELKYLFSTLNGVRLSMWVATKMKRSGMTKGVLDLWLPCRRGEYAGLVIELKHGDNHPTAEQQEWIAFLNSQGYFACARWGHEDTIATITAYLEGRL
jgi:hypothetical protein